MMRTTPPPISGFTSLSLPDFTTVTLPNGIRLHYYSGGNDPVTRMAVIWNAGSLDVDDPSTLSMLASMLTEGCEGASGQEISDIFEGCGAWVRIQETPHSLMGVLHSLNHTVHTVFPLLAKVLTKANFPEEALESLKQKAAADKRLAMERPSFRAAVAARRALYGDTPMGRVITPESIMAVERSHLLNLHRNLLLSNLPDIYIAGEIDDSLLSAIFDSFGTLQFQQENPEAVRYTPAPAPELSIRETIHVEMPASLQTAIKYQLPTITQGHPDYDALQMAVMVLGGYFGSRLMNNLREEHGYTYGVNARLNSQPDCASISITLDCDNSYADACLEEIDKEIRRMAREPIPQEELDTARQVVISSLSSILDSPITIEAYREVLAASHLTGDELSRKFQAISLLTPEEIRRATARYLADAPGVIALAGGRPGIG